MQCKYNRTKKKETLYSRVLNFGTKVEYKIIYTYIITLLHPPKPSLQTSIAAPIVSHPRSPCLIPGSNVLNGWRGIPLWRRNSPYFSFATLLYSRGKTRVTFQGSGLVLCRPAACLYYVSPLQKVGRQTWVPVVGPEGVRIQLVRSADFCCMLDKYPFGESTV